MQQARADRTGFIKGLVEGTARCVTTGRWPANVLLDPEAAAMLDAQTGNVRRRRDVARRGKGGEGFGRTAPTTSYADKGGASRFFYVAKASEQRRAGRVRRAHAGLCATTTRRSSRSR
jgi:hypothetical protein